MERVQRYLMNNKSRNSYCSTQEILDHLGIDPGKQGKADANRVGKILKKLGYESKQVTIEGKRKSRWVENP